MYVCIHICMNADILICCMHVDMCVCICMYGWMNVCICVCSQKCMVYEPISAHKYVCIYVDIHA